MVYQVSRLSDPRHGYLNLRLAPSAITVHKTSDNGVVEGFKFKFTKLDDEGNPVADFEPVTSTTDANGDITELALDPGTYLVEEVEIPNIYKQDIASQTVTIDVGKPGELTFANKSHKVSLAKTSENGVVEGLEFKITCEALDFETTKKTDAEGKWTLYDLQPGTYTIEEINVPDTFVAPAPLTATVTDTTDEIVITANNLMRGQATKVDATDGETGVKGATVRITDKETGAVFVGVTDETGSVYFPYQYGHSYTYEETLAPAADDNEYIYDLQDRVYEFSVDEQGVITGDTQMLEIRSGTVVLSKIDVTDGAPVEGAVISIMDANEEVIYTATTDDLGHIYFYPWDYMQFDVKGNLVDEDGKKLDYATFYFKEDTQPLGYAMNEDDVLEFHVKPDGTVTGKTFMLNWPDGVVVLKKVNPEDQPLQGAVLAVYQIVDDVPEESGTTGNGDQGQPTQETEVKKKEVLVYTGTTDEFGRIYFDARLTGPGDYYFIEKAAPSGYLLNSEKCEFSIDDDMVVSGVQMMVDAHDPGPSTGSNPLKKTHLLIMAMLFAFLVGTCATGSELNKRGKNKA